MGVLFITVENWAIFINNTYFGIEETCFLLQSCFHPVDNALHSISIDRVVFLEQIKWIALCLTFEFQNFTDGINGKISFVIGKPRLMEFTRINSADRKLRVIARFQGIQYQ